MQSSVSPWVDLPPNGTAEGEGFSTNVTIVDDETDTISPGVDVVRLGGSDFVRIGFPVTILLGTIGNGLTLAVMLRTALRRSTTSLLLATLAIVDTLVLYVLFFRTWLERTYDIVIQDESAIICKSQAFLSYSLSQFSPWIIVLIAIERLIVVFVPHKAKLLLTRRRVALGLVAIGLTLVVANAHAFWTYEYHKNNCFHSSDSAYVVSWLDSLLSSLIPATILIASNCAIIVKIALKQKISEDNQQWRIKSAGMTVVLFAISFIFLTTTAPLVILHIWGRYKKDTRILLSHQDYLGFIYSINYSINFLIYCISGSRFRRELVKMVRCG